MKNPYINPSVCPWSVSSWKLQRTTLPKDLKAVFSSNSSHNQSTQNQNLWITPSVLTRTSSTSFPIHSIQLRPEDSLYFTTSLLLAQAQRSTFFPLATTCTLQLLTSFTWSTKPSPSTLWGTLAANPKKDNSFQAPITTAAMNLALKVLTSSYKSLYQSSITVWTLYSKSSRYSGA